MSKRPPRAWETLRYLDATQILVGLRKVQKEYPLEQLRYEAAALRTRELRRYNEGRQAVLFCYGMGQLLGCRIEFALFESQDFDIVTRHIQGDRVHYGAVHLNRAVQVDPQKLRLPIGYRGALWLYGATDYTQDNWILMGNLADKKPGYLHFTYPTAQNP